MKHLIIEGPDRTGKDSLITGLLPFCQNAIITHFSTPVGNSDAEKRAFQEKSFDQEFAKVNVLEKSFSEPKPGKLNMIIWNRAHLGEFVYGNLYRQTNPEEWVMSLEEKYGFDKSDNVYLLLLTAEPEFLSAKDDGESFDASVEARKKELVNFRGAFHMSSIKKKLEMSEPGYVSEFFP
jgi:thymidylate kinase